METNDFDALTATDDKQKGKLIVVRDRVGMKPVYYSVSAGVLTFSSEMRGILATGVDTKLDRESARLFFSFGYVPGKRTLVEGVSKLRPGEILCWDFEKKVATYSWIPKAAEREKPKDLKQLRSMIANSVEEHTMGIRPYGLFLSGGMDSSILLHELAQRHQGIHTFTTRFDSRHTGYNDDADVAKELAKIYNTNHHELLICEQDFIDAIIPAVRTLEEPRYNHSFPAYWLLAKEAEKDITVILDGSGGDELFHGYPRYQVAREIDEKYKKYPRAVADLLVSYFQYKKTGKIERLSLAKNTLEDWTFLSRILDTKSHLALSSDTRASFQELARLLEGDVPEGEFDQDMVNNMALLDQRFWLADENFLRNDKISMHFGMEGRFPLLGERVRVLAMQYSTEEKLAHGTKSILRSTYSGVLPDIVTRKKKTGWNAPVSGWMSGALGEYVCNVLSREYYPDMNEFVDVEYVRKSKVEAVSAHDLSTIKQFLPFFYFMIWAKEFHMHL
jgi:asparagine synthase (glutamine-hydrolysing)